jgi:hypothetical protein
MLFPPSVNVNMPKSKLQFKYKCCEIACGKIIRGDKWNQHCHANHGFQLKRGHDVRGSTQCNWEGIDFRLGVHNEPQNLG